MWPASCWNDGDNGAVCDDTARSFVNYGYLIVVLVNCRLYECKV